MRIELKNITKSYQDRFILNIKTLAVYDQDKIGIVGLNGSGKTTLLKMISGEMEPDEGQVKTVGGIAYIRQFEAMAPDTIADEVYQNLSGGEKTRLKITAAFNEEKEILLADEPTSNLDLKEIKKLEEMLTRYEGALLLVSHDRALMDKVCSKIVEIEQGQIRVYPGNYSSYLEQKEKIRERENFEYQQFKKEKKKLTQALGQRKEQSSGVRKTPKRMGNSEARLHKMGDQKAKASLDKAAKALETRIDQLEVKNRPPEIEKMKITVPTGDSIYSKLLISGENLNKAFQNKIIFSHAAFKIFNGEKIALVGDNGSGKSTLIKMILKGEAGISRPKNLKIGYFSQDLQVLDENKTIIENVLSTSVHHESFVRTILARLLFRQDAIYKPVSLLSGGERVRALLGKIILSDINMLILDEPTNYLDIHAMEALEEVLRDYEGSMLFVSHDRQFMNKVASGLLMIENQKIIPFQGNYEQYCLQQQDKTAQDIKERKLLLENRLSQVIGRITAPSKKDNLEALNQEYKEIMLQLKAFNH